MGARSVSTEYPFEEVKFLCIIFRETRHPNLAEFVYFLHREISSFESRF